MLSLVHLQATDFLAEATAGRYICWEKYTGRFEADNYNVRQYRF